MGNMVLKEMLTFDCTVEKGNAQLKINCDHDNGFAVTPLKYKTPLTIELEAKTDSTNIRLVFAKGMLIFNWECGEEELRFHDPLTGKAYGIPGQGKVPVHEWVRIGWTITESYAAVSVNGVERYRKSGNYADAAGQIGVGAAWGSTIEVKQLTIEGETTDVGRSIPEIIECNETIHLPSRFFVNGANLSGTRFRNIKGEPLEFECVTLAGTRIQNANLSGIRIADANLSDMEIDGAQIGGAYIHHIGMPPEGHPAYDPNAVQRPVRFEHCELSNSTITSCNLSNVEITDCNITGLKINGILIEDLLQAYARG